MSVIRIITQAKGIWSAAIDITNAIKITLFFFVIPLQRVSRVSQKKETQAKLRKVVRRKNISPQAWSNPQVIIPGMRRAS